MLVGHDTLEKLFKRIIKDRKLSHGYIFFGEPQIGKYSFALSLASYLETKSFDQPKRFLSETFIVNPDEKEAIGIDKIREIKHFLSQKPILSEYRVAIIDDAQALTPQAQNSILKIAEEPPISSLIILILPNPDILMATLQSRFQKIYFPRIKQEKIIELLVEQFKISKKIAVDISNISFGRPGRAINIATNSNGAGDKTLTRIKNRMNKKQIIDQLVENNEMLMPFFSNIIAELAIDPIKNLEALRSIINGLVNISRFTTNRRLQLEAALWNI
jgi:DNA polymerase-3 subunit delta'